MNTPLARKIKTFIRANGPISVTDYFALCLADPEHGYYKTRDPLGQGGDFITAPEVSQLFGEMLGVFLVHAWQQHLTPRGSLRIAEIGPGRGTMMADMLRAIRKLAPELYSGATVHMVETSPALRTVQGETLREHGGKIAWHEAFDEIPEGFLLLVANEFFDAVPIRQFVQTGKGFRERMIGLGADDELAFLAGSAGIDALLLPEDFRTRPPGTIFEIAPARAAIMQQIADRLFDGGGTAAIIDYGHFETAFGDTLQAIRDHAFDPPLAHPGEADLTSHVDFQSLAEVALSRSVTVNGMATQANFLVGLGILERAGALGKNKTADEQLAIQQAIRRLIGDGRENMGDLFKVLVLSSPSVQLLPFSQQTQPG